MQKSIILLALCASSAPALAQNSGHVSYYGSELAGRKTASGERFNPGGMTAAHRTLPFGTRLKLTNVTNGRSAVVRINDRGPFVRGRVLDVSKGAAQVLGFVGQGTATLRIERLDGAGLKQFAAAETPKPVDNPAPVEASIEPEAPADVLVNDRLVHN